MHAHLEPLPARQHLSATLDPSFGTNGVATLPSDALQTLAVSDGLFVRYNVNGGFAIGKLTIDGKPDTAWGDGGLARVPFGSVNAWSYDARFGRLIVGGTDTADSSPELTEAKVLRLGVDGQPDSSFGDDGIYTYTPPQDASSKDSPTASAEIDSLTVLPHGGLLVGLSRGQSNYSSYNDPEYGGVTSSSSSVHESTLLKLRGNGRRDVTFGRRGLRSVTFNESYSSYEYGEDSGSSQSSTIRAVTPDPKGNFVVTLEIKTRARYEGATTDSQFDVVSRRVKADGTLDPAGDAEWKLVDSQDRSGGGHVTTFDLWMTQPTDTGVRIVGRSSRNGVNSTPLAFDLDRGQPAVARSIKLPAGGKLESITPTRRGYLITGHAGTAKGYRPYVSILNVRLRPIVRWGDGGAVKVPEGEVALDPDGRLLLAGSGQVSRYRVTIGG